MTWQSKYSPAEKVVLNSILDLLSLKKDAQARLESQLKQINKVQRILEDKEVDLYISSWGFLTKRANQDSQFRRCGQFVLATVDLTDEKGKNPVHAVVSVVNGQIFSIHFNRPQKSLGTVVLLAKSELVQDPMDTAEKNKLPNVLLPHDYLEFEGKDLNHWIIHDRNAIYSVVPWDDEFELYIIAEKEGVGWIAASVDDDLATHFFFVDGSGKNRTAVGNSLKEACSRF